MKLLKVLSLILIVGFISCENERENTNQSTDQQQVQKHQVKQKVQQQQTKVSYSEASDFANKRASSVGQRVIADKISYGYGGDPDVFLFFSVDDGMNFGCISQISENKLEIYQSDCGDINSQAMIWYNTFGTYPY